MQMLTFSITHFSIFVSVLSFHVCIAGYLQKISRHACAMIYNLRVKEWESYAILSRFLSAILSRFLSMQCVNLVARALHDSCNAHTLRPASCTPSFIHRHCVIMQCEPVLWKHTTQNLKWVTLPTDSVILNKYQKIIIVKLYYICVRQGVCVCVCIVSLGAGEGSVWSGALYHTGV